MIYNFKKTLNLETQIIIIIYLIINIKIKINY